MFREAVNNILDKNIPSKNLNGKWNLPWINQSLKRQIRKKQRMYTKAKGTNKWEDWKKYRQFRNKTKRNIKKQYCTYMNTIIVLIKTKHIEDCSDLSKARKKIPQVSVH